MACQGRDIFRAAFKSVELPYFNPHSFRKTLWALASERGLDEEGKKAWSQNLGHEKMDTSVNYCGPVSVDRQRMRMLEMHDKRINPGNNRAALIADVLAVIDARESRKLG